LIKVIKFLKKSNFFGGIGQLLVWLMRKSEESFTSIALIVSLLDNLIFFSLGLESLKSFMGLKTGFLGTVLFELITEFINVKNKLFSVALESCFEFGSLSVHAVTDNVSLFNKRVPFFLDQILTVEFFLRENFTSQHGVNKKSIHCINGSNIVAEFSLLLADFFKGLHNASK
jgi:hypothetical protein